MGGGGGWLGVILNGPILNGLRCISACKTRGIVESGSEHQNENAKIYNFNSSNMFNPLPLDQVYPLYSWGNRPGIRIFSNVGALVKSHFGTHIYVTSF